MHTVDVSGSPAWEPVVVVDNTTSDTLALGSEHFDLVSVAVAGDACVDASEDVREQEHSADCDECCEKAPERRSRDCRALALLLRI